MKKKLSCLIIMLITFFFLSETCKAEPDSTIRYLMNEPVSMLDFGLFRLKGRLNEGRLSESVLHEYVVNYQPDINRIYINRIILGKEIQNIPLAKDECKREVKKIRSVAVPGIFQDSFTSFLSYEPNDLAKKLMAITEIHIFAYYGEKIDIKSSFIHCTAPLLGKDIYFTEKD